MRIEPGLKAEPPADGFYVEPQCCTSCGVPQAVAPSLVGWTDESQRQCIWKKQPETESELRQAFAVFDQQELGCHRYAGLDPDIQVRVGAGNCDRPLQVLTFREGAWGLPPSLRRLRLRVLDLSEKFCVGFSDRNCVLSTSRALCSRLQAQHVARCHDSARYLGVEAQEKQAAKKNPPFCPGSVPRQPFYREPAFNDLVSSEPSLNEPSLSRPSTAPAHPSAHPYSTQS
jgi:hypothetical protein